MQRCRPRMLEIAKAPRVGEYKYPGPPVCLPSGILNLSKQNHVYSVENKSQGKGLG